MAAVYAFMMLLPLCLLVEAWRIAPVSRASARSTCKWLAVNGVVSFLNQYTALSVLDAMHSPLSRKRRVDLVPSAVCDRRALCTLTQMHWQM